MALALPERWRPPRVDIAIAGGLVLLSQVDVWLLGSGGHDVAGAMTMGAMGASLAWRRIAPLAVAIVATGLMFLTALLGGPPGIPTNVACLWLAYFGVGAMPDRRRSLIGLVFGLAAALFMNDGGFDLNLYLAIALTSFGLPWAVGSMWWRRRHAQQLQDQVATAAQEAVDAERARLAREIHDVVSHGISMIAVQAAAADVLLENSPVRSRQALHAIEEGARQALVEMRQLLHLLQTGMEPEPYPVPCLSDLDALVARVRSSGLPVTLQIDGTPRPVSDVVNLAAYRVVQEGLTNVLKHAGPCSARVHLHYGQHLTITVRDSGRGPVGRESPGGFGLSGLDERVREVGGMLGTRIVPEGGFELSVRLPLPDVA